MYNLPTSSGGTKFSSLEGNKASEPAGRELQVAGSAMFHIDCTRGRNGGRRGERTFKPTLYKAPADVLQLVRRMSKTEA